MMTANSFPELTKLCRFKGPSSTQQHNFLSSSWTSGTCTSAQQKCRPARFVGISHVTSALVQIIIFISTYPTVSFGADSVSRSLWDESESAILWRHEVIGLALSEGAGRFVEKKGKIDFFHSLRSFCVNWCVVHIVRYCTVLVFGESPNKIDLFDSPM